MGFLDHSTNNIIIDAVLTDYGRRLLAENQGGFKIAFFSLADDEVDYSTIRKFGRMVGKEKIAKNTPIFEAQTTTNLAMKHRLISIPNPLITIMPTLNLSSEITNGSAGTLGTNSVKFTGASPVTMKFGQTLATSVGADGSLRSVPAGLSDKTFTVLMNDRFFFIDGGVKLSTQPNTKIAAYQVAASESNHGGVQNASACSVIVSRRTIDTSLYTTFGDAGTTTISTVLSVIGDQSGLRRDIKLQISPL